MKNLKKEIRKIPHSPGCYKYYDKKGKLLYIGKAKDLRRRVTSYFTGSLDFKTQILVENIYNVKCEVTDSEIEALILESLLIKKYKPKFNIKIKDDKDFLWIKLDLSQKYPQPEFVRRFDGKDHGKIRVFGPFTDSKLLKKGMDALRKVFLWRDCSSSKFSFYQKRKKPCLEYYIKNCSAPCQLDNDLQKGVVSKKEALSNNNDYQLNIKQLTSFLKGNKKTLIKTFEKEMLRLSQSKNFEGAARFRDKIRALKHMDAILGVKFRPSNRGANDKKYFTSNIQYLKNIIKILNSSLDYTISFKKDFRIEFYDISNISGKEAVGSMVVSKGGGFDKNSYRKFKIRSTSGPDDTKMMREVLSRRIKKSTKYKLQTTNKYQVSNTKFQTKDPDLIILDGGKSQLGAIWRLFQELNVDIPVISLAKREEEIYGVQSYKAIKLIKLNINKNSPESFFIQRLRDEAHRFAIGYHKKLREKRIIRSRLDSIDGVGPKTKKKLLLKFGSVDGIIRASVGEIAEVVGKKLAERIKEGL